MRPYEVMVIIDAGLDEESIRATIDRATALVTKGGGTVGKVDRWGNVEHARLGPDGWRRVVARRAERPKRHRAPVSERG